MKLTLIAAAALVFVATAIAGKPPIFAQPRAVGTIKSR